MFDTLLQPIGNPPRAKLDAPCTKRLTKKYQMLSLRVEVEMLEKLREQAALSDHSVSNLVRIYIARNIAR